MAKGKRLSGTGGANQGLMLVGYLLICGGLRCLELAVRSVRSSLPTLAAQNGQNPSMKESQHVNFCNYLARATSQYQGRADISTGATSRHGMDRSLE